MMQGRLGPGARLVLALALLLAAGCSPTPPPAVNPTAKGTSGGVEDNQHAANGNSSNTAATPAVKAELEPLAPLDPPPLAELDAKAEWESQPVLNALELLKQRQTGEQSLAAINEALRLKNDGPAANQKILSAIGRLPEQANAVNYGASINRHSLGDVKSTNPLLQRSTIEQELSSLIGVKLFNFDWGFKPFGNQEVISSWQTSKDHLMDKVVLRDDLTWSDGRPITAHDVQFSFETIIDRKVSIPAVRTGTEQLRWVEAYDDRTLVMFHKEPLATNVWNIQFPVIPRHIYQDSIKDDPTLLRNEHHKKHEIKPVCGGRYVLEDRKQGQYMLLSRRESWFMHGGKQVRDKPYFEQIRIKIMDDPNSALLSLKGGELDEMELTPDQWMTQTGDDDFYKHNTKVSGPQWTYSYFGWNNDPDKAPFFTDQRVRKAMSYAFNHKEMLDTLLYGQYEPCNGIYHRTAWMAPRKQPPLFRQDLDKAEDLLDEAGWVDSDNDGLRDKTIKGRKIDFEFTILTHNAPLRVQICTLLANNLETINVKCHISPVDFTTWQSRVQEHNFQAQLGAWGTPADPDASESVWVTGQDRNYVQYANPEVDRLFEQGRRELDPAKRAEIYGRIHAILYEDQPYTWLYFRNAFYGVNKRLRGFVLSPRGPYSYGPGFDAIWTGTP